MAGTDQPELHRHLVDLIWRHGPLPFSVVMDTALYDEDHGFYSASGGAAGRRGDFLTSPEVGPLFGAVLARALDTWWDELGQPDPFVVIEGGAGVGTLALSILAAEPRCASALQYLMVERSPRLRARQGDHLALTEPAALAANADGGPGPLVASLSELPVGPVTGVVLANELLDNLAFDLLLRTATGWDEIRIGLDQSDPGAPRLVHHTVPAAEGATALAERLAPDAAPGAVIPWQREAGEWVARAAETLDRGRILIIDYAVRTTAELAARPMGQWLRAYRGHEQIADPLAAPGEVDITADVAVDQLALTAEIQPRVRTQAEFLEAFGIADLVEEGRQIWEERAGLGDLAAIRARSRIREAEALLDPAGFGNFLAVEWAVERLAPAQPSM